MPGLWPKRVLNAGRRPAAPDRTTSDASPVGELVGPPRIREAAASTGASGR